MWQLKNIETGDVSPSDVEPVLIGGIWECGSFRVTDPAGDQYESVALAVYPVISPMTFQMLFTVTEEVAIKKLVNGDPGAQPPIAVNEDIAVWWGRLTNTGLTEVDLGLSSVQGALQGLVALGVLAAERVPQILTGKLQ